MLPRDASPRAVRRSDYTPPAFRVDSLALRFELAPSCTRVRNRFEFHRNGAAVPGQALTLHGEQQKLLRVELDGRSLRPDEYVLGPRMLSVPNVGQAGVLVIESEIDPASNTALEGLYLSSGVFCTQCEPEGFRRITYFFDRPDVLTRYRVTIVAERTRFPRLLSNGNLLEQGDVENQPGFHYAVWDDPFPKPSYLFALVAGDLASLDDSFVTRSGRRVLLQIYSTPANLPMCRHAMASVKRAMRWDEERFGREYDLDRFMIFCADDFNMGAMENKGLNIFNSKLVLADAASATDADFEAIEAVVGHEYFHNWTGNRVTCRDWFQLSLKEGLTVFRDQEFSSDLGSRAVERIQAVNFLRTHQFPEDAGPMAHSVRPESYVEINNFYTTTVYEKGAELIRMQHALLGEAAFRRGMDLYFERHDGRAVTCDDFVAAMQAASGVDLEQFKHWYSQAGTPELSITGTYDREARTYTLDIEQTCPATPGQPEKQPFHMPLAVGLLGADGSALPLRETEAGSVAGSAATDATTPATTRMLQVRESHQQFVFTDVDEAPVPSLLRGFSAPVKIHFPYERDELVLLARCDMDPVSRWDAAQRIWCDTLLEQSERYRRGEPMLLDPTLVAVARALLADDTSDPALRALALAPPQLPMLAELRRGIDVEALHASLRNVVRLLAGELEAEFAAAYGANAVVEPYEPKPEQIARRSLRNRCLQFLGCTDGDGGRALAHAQFESADNMTDTIGAMLAVNDSASAERTDMFQRFEARWHDHPLAMDKWFGLEATRDASDTLQRVSGLRSHAAYQGSNPNRIRALIGSFATRNWPAFHQSGEAHPQGGYAFVADQVLLIDSINPQIAARLASAFNRWRRFDPVRAALQRDALTRIVETPGVSPDVLEIVSNALAD